MTLLVRTTRLLLRERSGDNQRPIVGATIHIEVRVKENGNPTTKHQTVTTDGDGRAIFEALPIGKFRVWGERSDGSPLDIVAIDGLQIPPGLRPWLREKNLKEFGTFFDILALPPPVMLNFRLPDDEDANKQWRLRRSAAGAESETWYRLNDDELEYLRENGGNATIIVHGYNVALGEPPTSRQVTTDTVTAHALQSRDGPDDPRSEATPGDQSVYSQLHGANEIEDPVPHKGFVEIQHLENTGSQAHGYNDPERLKRLTPGIDWDQFDSRHHVLADKYNGSGVWAWHVGMEGNLNRAAGGDYTVDYTRYQRTIGVTWSGNRGLVNFWGAEMAANATGRMLVPLLVQLADAGIPTNIIAHSLGARVVLTALNLLAQMRNEATVDQVILWEPAVTENALADEASLGNTDDVDPIAHQRFPQAATATNRLVVLHSERDGVLGPKPDEFDPPDAAAYDNETHDDTSRWDEDAAEELRGIYDRRYLFEDDLAARYLEPDPAARAAYEAASSSTLTTDLGALASPYPIWTYDTSNLRLQLYTKLNAEAEIAMPTRQQAEGLEPLPYLGYLKPWGKQLYFTHGDIEMIIDRLVRLFEQRSNLPYTETKAMGWSGPNLENPKTRSLLGNGLEVVDETDELASHSAMWFADNLLFEQIVRGEVVRRFFQPGQPGFGQYQFGESG